MVDKDRGSSGPVCGLSESFLPYIAYVRMRQHTSAYDSIRQHTLRCQYLYFGTINASKLGSTNLGDLDSRGCSHTFATFVLVKQVLYQ